MIQREIEKAMSGRKFFSHDESGKPVYHLGIDFEIFFHYYQVWEDFHVTGHLPHGKGTLGEPRWVIDIIKIFEKAHDKVVSFFKEKAYKEAMAGRE